MTRASFLVVVAVLLAVVAAGVLATTNFFGISLPFMKPSEQELVAQMTEVAALGGFAVTFSDADSKKWKLAPGHRLEKYSLEGSDAAMARISASAPLAMVPPGVATFSWADQGMSVVLPQVFAQRSNGQVIEVAVIARRAQTNSSDNILVAYATQQAGNSGWQHLKLASDFQLLKFQYRVPAVAEGYHESPIIVMNADPEGKGRTVELLGVYVKVTGANGA